MTPWVTRLVILNALVFLLTLANPYAAKLLMFVPALIADRPWTIITYMFVHAGFWHIFFNMMGLWFFGPRLEVTLGSAKFLWLYFLSGICGGLLSFVFAPMTPIVGASAAVFGVFYAFAHFWPKEHIYVWGILPVEARWFVLGMTALSLLGGFGGFEEGIAHFAHLGGFAGGFLYIRWIEKNSRAARYQEQQEPPPVQQADLERWMGISREGMHEVNREELDRVQAKLAKTGVQSLTPNEIAFLNRFSDR
jgi:membrane associated rhomboid family serine protease